MKQLTLLRHGKSDWETTAEHDFDRPLKERGRKDAPLMGRMLVRAEAAPDLIITSTALRALQTAELLAEALDYQGEVRQEGSLYAASAQELLAVVRHLPDEATHVLLVGHNPGLEDLVARLIGADAFEMVTGVRLPTAAAAHLTLAAAAWSEVQANSGQLEWLVTPKLVRAL